MESKQIEYFLNTFILIILLILSYSLIYSFNTLSIYLFTFLLFSSIVISVYYYKYKKIKWDDILLSILIIYLILIFILYSNHLLKKLNNNNNELKVPFNFLTKMMFNNMY